jgi:hypothetical protein
MTPSHKLSSLGTIRTFMKEGSCSGALCTVLNRAFEKALPDEEFATMLFAGGIMQHGYQCGLLWGSALAAGAEAHRRFGPGPKAEAMAILAAQRLVTSFRTHHKYIDCADITGLDDSSSTLQMVTTFLLKGQSVKCFRMSAQFARVAFRDIDAAFRENQLDEMFYPVSCAAEVARKMGASELQATMAAGLAGGIGFSGGACGALGAAVWIIAMRQRDRKNGTVEFKDEKALQAVERFLQASEYKFECADIVGKNFDSLNDHADFICGGGCEKIIKILSAH